MTLIILSILLAVVFLFAGAAKLRALPQMVDMSRNLGIAWPQFRLAGVLEILFAVLVVLGIWVGWIGTLGAMLLTATMAVAILAHARVDDAPVRYAPPAILGILAFVLLLVHVY
jgi:uncharacterized membrane protein YphA (DoxX/SURF4 family)